MFKLELIIAGAVLQFAYMLYRKYCTRYIPYVGPSGCRGDIFGGDDGGDAEAAYNAAVQPARDLQAAQLDIFKTAYKPYIEDISKLWGDYGKGIQTEQLKTYQDVGLPAYRSLGEKFSADLANPWLDMEKVSGDIWQKTRERTVAEFAPYEQRTSQRLAGAGALDTGAAIKAFGDIEQVKYKSLENQAIDQAINEFNAQAQAKQQAYSNMSSYINNQPTLNMNPISAYANYNPQVIPPYTEQDTGGDMTGLGALLGMGAAGVASVLIPGSGIGLGGLTGLQATALGGAAGGALGSMFKGR